MTMIENGSRAATPPSTGVGTPENRSAGRREVIERPTPNGSAAAAGHGSAAVEQAA